MSFQIEVDMVRQADWRSFRRRRRVAQDKFVVIGQLKGEHRGQLSGKPLLPVRTYISHFNSIPIYFGVKKFLKEMHISVCIMQRLRFFHPIYRRISRHLFHKIVKMLSDSFNNEKMENGKADLEMGSLVMRSGTEI